jgi:hypothetical protein
MSWLHDTIVAVAVRAGLDPAALEPSPKQKGALLDVARIAAHASGERTNAPLLCFALGQAVAGGASLDDAIAAVKEHAGEA